jgi:hypothetical protein
MAPCPEVLILFFDALMTDDGQFVGKMLRRFPLLGKKTDTLTPEERNAIFSAVSMTNHFYTSRSSTSTRVDFGIVLTSTDLSRKLVSECKLDEFVYWGANTAPFSLPLSLTSRRPWRRQSSTRRLRRCLLF